jgi:hypothetical protein
MTGPSESGTEGITTKRERGDGIEECGKLGMKVLAIDHAGSHSGLILPDVVCKFFPSIGMAISLK